jgi:hypothetical protein
MKYSTSTFQVRVVLKVEGPTYVPLIAELP